MKAYHHLMTRLHRDERGTSLTEFVIGLPIMITIMVGTLSLYKLNQAAMENKAQAARNAWADTIPAQTNTIPNPLHMTLTGNAVASVFDGSLISGSLLTGTGMSKSVIKGLANNPAGNYVDSYTKTQMANALFDVGAKPGLNIGKILREDGKDTRSFVKNTHKEVGLPSSGGGIYGIAAGALDMLGSRQAIIAGMRYGVGDGEESVRDYSEYGFETQFKEQYTIQLPSKSTHRVFALATSRLDMNSHPDRCSKKHYKDMLKFNGVLVPLPTLPCGSRVKGPTDEDSVDPAARCAQRTQAWQSDPANNPKPACAEDPPSGSGKKAGKGNAKKGKEMMNCIQNAARNGQDPADVCDLGG